MSSTLINISNLYLVAGDARNIGKTHLGCYLISNLSNTVEVIAIKISPHMHQLNEDCIVLAGDKKNWIISEETNPESHKDSGRFLAAGAIKSYYVQTASDEYLPLVIEWIQKLDSNGKIMVCESRALGNYLKPGKAFFISSDQGTKKCTWNFNYEKLYSENQTIENIEKIRL